MEKTVFLVIWLLLLYINGTCFFLRGFLLTRRESSLQSSLDDGVSCCLPHKYQKVIILVIDALRYDFILNDETGTDVLPYQNNMPFLTQLLENSSASLFQFMADPPTTTLQRLKGLTTGSLPTFIDVGNNFASNELTEDNIINQIQLSGMNLTFMGDDTWMGLFPSSFQKSYPYPSFDVWDIHTVDNGVASHLFTEMSKTDWQVLIAHCLGVDHIGHRYGPHHPQMKLKLEQMNLFVHNIVKAMDNESLLLVMGDHGMTKSGDHGGDSTEELKAALFAYSHRMKASPKHVKGKVMHQVDLVPTLALLLGIPIPFSNLGSVNLDLISPEKNPDSTEEQFNLTEEIYFSNALYLNVKQIWRYLSSYEGSNFPSNELEQLETLLQDIERLHQELARETVPHKNSFRREMILKSQSFLSSSREMCRSIWAQFDMNLIWIGTVIFAVALIINYVSMNGAFVDCNIIKLAAVCSFIAIVFQGSANTVLISFALNVIPSVLFLSRSWCNSVTIHFNPACFASVVTAAFYTSNSFVNEEPYVVHYLVQSWIWIPLLLRKGHSKSQWLIRAILSGSVRLGLGFFRCREEQYPQCVAHQLYRSLTSVSDPSYWTISTRIGLAGLTLVVLHRGFLRVRGGSTRIITGLVTIVFSHWLLEATSVLLPSARIDAATLTILPRIFYTLFCIYAAYLISLLTRNGCKDMEAYWRHSVDLVAAGSTLALLLAGDGLAPGIGSILTNLGAVMLLFSTVNDPEKDRWIMWPLYGYLSLHGFYAGGHHTSLPNIPWESAFIGFSHASNQSGWSSNILPSILVGYSTSSSAFLHALAVPIVALSPLLLDNENKDRIRVFKIDQAQAVVTSATVYHLLFHAVRLFGCMGAAAIHRRHLMVWKIFAPRLLYELVLAVSMATGLLISLCLYLVTTT